MKACILFVVLLSFLSSFSDRAQLRMEIATQRRFITAHGRRAGLGGYSNADMEVWAVALQIASNAHPSSAERRTQRPVISAASANLQKINQNLYELNIPVSKDSSTYTHLQTAVEFAH